MFALSFLPPCLLLLDARYMPPYDVDVLNRPSLIYLSPNSHAQANEEIRQPRRQP